MSDFTGLLRQARAGDSGAHERLFSQVYADLKRMAARQLGAHLERGLATTSLVHETYLRLARPEALELADRAHFFAVAARAMRQLIIDHARHRQAGKRGGGDAPIDLDTAALQVLGASRDEELVALDQALEQLAQADPLLAQVVEMRFFGGMELTEIAPLLDRSERSLKRDWRKARAFLHGVLGGDGKESDVA